MRRKEKRRKEQSEKLIFLTALVGLLRVIAELILTIIKESR